MSTPQDKHAGNEGDVWKHYVLTEVLGSYVSRIGGADSKSFLYFESHAGKGEYTLGVNKENERGILEVLERFDVDSDNFYLALERKTISDSRSYLGSWRLAEALLDQAEIEWTMQIHDTSVEVETCVTEILETRSNIRFQRSDGFGALDELDADFILVDPYENWSRSAWAAKLLSAREMSFLVRYPIFRPDEPSELVKETDLAGLEVLWRPMHRNVSRVLRGCGLLVAKRLWPLAEENLSEFSKFARRLNWQMHLRTP